MKKSKLVLFIFFISILSLKLFSNNPNNSVIITGTFSKPVSFDDIDTIKWQGEYPDSYVEIVVKGRIINFEVVTLKYSNDDLVEFSKELFIDAVENKTIVLKTSLPEGIPYEKIKWSDSAGNNYEYLISDYNTGIGPASHTFDF